MRLRHILFLSLLITFASYGCSGGGDTPILPSGTDNNPGISPTLPQDPTEGNERTSAGDEYEGMRIPLAFYSVTANPDAGTLEYVPLRTAQKHLNAIPLLETATEQLVSLAGPPQFSDGGTILDVDIKLTHPNDDPVLTAFDVHGIFITKGSLSGFGDPDIVVAGFDETRLMNPDGMTRWWNPKEFLNGGLNGYVPGNLGNVIPGDQAATLNGYKMFAYGLQPDEDLFGLDEYDRGMLYAGSECTRHYTISLASGLKFNYAVDASWAFPLNVPPDPPGDFPAKANAQEPYRILVTEISNNLWHSGEDHGGMATYEVTIWDWQGADTFSTVRIDIPQIGLSDELGFFNDYQYYNEYAYQVWMPDLQNDDDLYVLFSVDSDDGTYHPALTGVDKPLRAYFNHVIEVGNDPSANIPPLAHAVATTATEIESGESVSFDASGSLDLDGLITAYEWDFNGDDIYGDEYDSGDDIYPTKIFDLSGTFVVDVRVTDNNGAEDMLLSTITIDVNNKPPTAVGAILDDPPYFINTYYELSAADSFDVDGVITAYDWDFEWDGFDFNPMDEGETIIHHWGSEGAYNIMLRVTDNLGAEDFIEEAFEISVFWKDNVGPTFDYIEMSRTTTLKNSIGEAITFTCYATDLDTGDVLTYEWSCDAGYFLSEDDEVAVWVSPDVVGHYYVHCKVSDIAGEWDEGDSDMIRVTKYPTVDMLPIVAPPAPLFTLDTIWDGSSETVSLADYVPGNVVMTDYWQIG